MDHQSLGLLTRPSPAVAELRNRNPTLAWTAASFVALLGAFLVGIALDARIVGGEPVWLKPAKFAGSLALLAASLAWLSPHLPVADRTLRWVSRGIVAGAAVEIALIGGQAARGVESHFNDATPLDAAVYNVMGATIVAVLLLVAVLAAAAWTRSPGVDPAFAWGIRLGLAVFVLGSLEGGAMVAAGASAVGGGSTVPVLGWSVGGDFRVAHFVGLHGLQVLPLTGYLSARARQRGRLAHPVRVVVAVAAVQTAVLAAAFAHALGVVG